MHVSEIKTSYSFNPNTGEYWGKKEVSVHLNEGDNPDEANELSQNSVVKYQALMPKPSIPTIPVERKETNGDQHIIDGINKCTTIEQLSKEWKLVAAQNKNTQQAFDKHLAKLQTKPNSKNKIKLP